MVLRGLLRVERLQELGRGLGHLAVLGPVGELDAVGLGEALDELDGLRPLVGLLDHVEARGGQRVADGPQLYLHQEEPEVAVGVLVEPLDGLAVLVAGAGHHPDHHLGTLASGVGDYLAQVVVVSAPELVLYDHLAPGPGLLRVNVHVERAH